MNNEQEKTGLRLKLNVWDTAGQERYDFFLKKNIKILMKNYEKVNLNAVFDVI